MQQPHSQHVAENPNDSRLSATCESPIMPISSLDEPSLHAANWTVPGFG